MTSVSRKPGCDDPVTLPAFGSIAGAVNRHRQQAAEEPIGGGFVVPHPAYRESRPRIAAEFIIGTHHRIRLVMPTLIEGRLTLHPDGEQRNQKHIPTGIQRIQLKGRTVVCAIISGVVMVPVWPTQRH